MTLFLHEICLDSICSCMFNLELGGLKRSKVMGMYPGDPGELEHIPLPPLPFPFALAHSLSSISRPRN